MSDSDLPEFETLSDALRAIEFLREQVSTLESRGNDKETDDVNSEDSDAAESDL